MSVKRVDYNKTEERSVQIFIPYEISFSLIFWQEEWLVGATPSTWKFWANRRPLERNSLADFWTEFARSASAVTPSEKKVINTNRKSNTNFLSPQGGGVAQKRKTADFRLKSHFSWSKSATKFLCVKTVSDKVVRHSSA